MKALLLAIVVIAALVVIAGGVWVAIALAGVVSARHDRAGLGTAHQDPPDCE